MLRQHQGADSGPRRRRPLTDKEVTLDFADFDGDPALAVAPGHLYRRRVVTDAISRYMSQSSAIDPLPCSPQDSRQNPLDSLGTFERFSLAPSDGERAGVRGFRGRSVFYATARSE
jgi:hypothetical protein